jgi:hypothetical protein
MRSDMDKVLVERPRRGGTNTGKRSDRRASKASLENEEGEKRQRMRVVHGDGNKELNENLNPLRRFLESRIGKKWDDVYSEIRKNNKPNSATKYHIFQHLEYMVELNPIKLKDGRVFARRIFEAELSFGDLYVLGGILLQYKRNKTRWRQKDRLPPANTFSFNKVRRRFKKIEEDGICVGYYIEIDGIWWEGRFCKRPTMMDVEHLERKVGKTWKDLFFRRGLGRTESDPYSQLTQLSKRDIKKLKLGEL